MPFKTSSKKCAEIDAASKAEEHLMSNITHPGLHDCLCGRGGHATNHPGNVQFRMLVNKYKDYYMGLSRYGKLQVAAEVVKLWRSQTPAGRFLAMTDPSNRENTTWHDIGDKEAIKKTSQCLRERIPPHQKPRTLAAISPRKSGKSSDGGKTKGKAIDGGRKQEEQESSSRPDDSTGRYQGDQPEISLHMSVDDDLQPTPILETAVVSLTSTPASPEKVKTNVSVDSMPTLDPLDLKRSPSPISFPAQIGDTSHSRVGSWAPTDCSSTSVTMEDIACMAEALLEEPQAIDEAVDVGYEDGTRTIGADELDGALIPSAANLTKDVFDDDMYKPLINGTTKVFGGGHEGGSASGVAPYHYTALPTATLSQTLSSNMRSIFSS